MVKRVRKVRIRVKENIVESKVKKWKKDEEELGWEEKKAERR